MSMLGYYRSFGQMMKESIKKATDWAAYYHTCRKSRYPKPEETVSLSQVPITTLLPPVEMPQADCDLMQNWASSYGAVVRQRTVRQETTMAKHGTSSSRVYLPETVCGIRPASNFKHLCQRTNWKSCRKQHASPSRTKENDDEIADEFDSSCDEEAEAEDAERGNSLLQREVGSSATFLLGARSRFGRVACVNNRFLS